MALRNLQQWDDDFARHEKRIRKFSRFVFVGAVVYLTVIVATLCFAGWVIIKILSHFGIL